MTAGAQEPIRAVAPPCGVAPPTSWVEMRRRLARDRQRLASLSGAAAGADWRRTSYLAVLMYRLSNYFYRRNHRHLARLLWQLNLAVTGADIAPLSEAGAGLVVVHPLSTTLYGTLGEDCTVWGYGGLGGGRSAIDIGGGPGLPVLGDRVELGLRALVLGPVRVGADCVIGPGCIIVHDLPERSEIAIAADTHAIIERGERREPINA